MNIGDLQPPPTKSSSPNMKWTLPSLVFLAWVMAFLSMAPVWAIDNPDGPNRVAEFLTRAEPFEQRLAEESSAAALASAAREYERFLDVELNQAYQQLLVHVGGKSRHALVASQRQWLLFRDAENSFINRNWTQEAFGSSSKLSRADYHAALVRQRIVILLAYLQNYSENPR
jgi:uncharacterized protein YecT (DUF1311 family)